MENNLVLETIRQRFSCRKFLNQPVEEEKLHAILDAAKYAPNGKNAQPWHFTVLRTEEAKRMLIQAAGEEPPEDFKNSPAAKVEKWPFQSDFCGAPVVIMISGRTDVPWPDIGPRLAAENLMIAATSLGLATLWSSAFTRDIFRDEKSCEVRDVLIPKGNQVYATLFVGYPEKVPEKRPARREDCETWL